MSAFELTGTLAEIMPTATFNKGFKKREFVIETDSGKYPQKIIFQLVQEKCDMINSFTLGDTVKVSFDIKGREFNGKYYNALEAWRVFGEKRASVEPEDDGSDIFDDPDLFPGKAKKGGRKIPQEDIEHVKSNDVDDDLPF